MYTICVYINLFTFIQATWSRYTTSKWTVGGKANLMEKWEYSPEAMSKRPATPYIYSLDDLQGGREFSSIYSVSYWKGVGIGSFHAYGNSVLLSPIGARVDRRASYVSSYIQIHTLSTFVRIVRYHTRNYEINSCYKPQTIFLNL